MRLIEIARFTDPGDAELAAYFLYRHGLNATAPSTRYSRGVGMALTGAVGETPVLVDASQAEEAIELFRRVLAGEFSDEDPHRNSKAGIGAALANAVLPDPTFRTPSRLAALAPLIVLLALPAIGFIGAAAFRFVRASLG